MQSKCSQENKWVFIIADINGSINDYNQWWNVYTVKGFSAHWWINDKRNNVQECVVLCCESASVYIQENVEIQICIVVHALLHLCHTCSTISGFVSVASDRDETHDEESFIPRDVTNRF